MLNEAKTAIVEHSENNEQGTINLTNNANNNNGSGIDIRADDTTNSLIITAPPATMKNLKQVISKFDITDRHFGNDCLN